MARDVIFDTETTGMDRSRDRIIQMTAKEMVNLRPTGASLTRLVNPQGRRSHIDAWQVHRIDDDALVGEPTFAEVWPEFSAFFGDARIVIHNAEFDTGMVLVECERFSLANPLAELPIEDTLHMARRVWPGKAASLDAICRRLKISLTARGEKHSSSVDCDLLGLAYAKMVNMINNPEVQTDIFAGAEDRVDPSTVPAIRVPRVAPRV